MNASEIPAADKFLWLEEIQGVEALSWVDSKNAETVKELKSRALYQSNLDVIREVLLAESRLPQVECHGDYLYNFWQDKAHRRGVWRRTSFAEFKKENPVWETVLDIDQLAERESEDWSMKWAVFAAAEDQMCLIYLSRGGLDAAVVREFDLRAKQFVKEGFILPQAKTIVAYVNRDTLLVGTDFGPRSKTAAGYSRIIKVWRRGEALESAPVIFEGDESDSSVHVHTDFSASGQRSYIVRNLDFYRNQAFVFDLVSGELRPLPKPDHAEVEAFIDGKDILRLRQDWQGFPSGSVLTLQEDGQTEKVFIPNSRQAVSAVARVRDGLIINYIENVIGKLVVARPGVQQWELREIDFDQPGNLTLSSTDSDGDLVIASFQDFLTPSSIVAGTAGSKKLSKIKSLPERFDSGRFKVEQKWATSRDGTQIPYFFVGPKNMNFDGNNPTLVYGYGGFETALTPAYLEFIGKVWLERGGCFVKANIRGGGEFGPRWHASALKQNRQRAFDDFQAVAEDLMMQKISSPQKLAIQGRSNGGLLVGACFVQRPDLYAAVVCGVPLLDMLRYNRLLAGASWMAEYGNPDVAEERAFLSEYSPYQNLRADIKYPEVFFYTSRTDDRVHPGHARKMAAKMMEFGHSCLYYENSIGGHAGSADPSQEAEIQALIFTFLHSRLCETSQA